MIKFATPFNLVSKPDRRQNPDRRSAWRGSRRLSDVRAAGQQLHGDGVVKWAPDAEASHEGRLDVKATKYLH